MSSRTIAAAKEFLNTLRCLQNDEHTDSISIGEEMEIVKMRRSDCDVLRMCTGTQPVFICQKYVPKMNKTEPLQKDESAFGEDDADDHEHDSDHAEVDVYPTDVGPQPLTVMKARQLLSWYTISQNTTDSVDTIPPTLPLWVRCDMSDPAGTSWFGAETVSSDKNIIGVKLFSITCKGSAVPRQALMTLDELKQEHKKRHHPSSMMIKGSARYDLLGSMVVENTVIESQSSVTVDFRWNHVEKILQTPPLSSAATLSIKVPCGGIASPMSEMYEELKFLQMLADGLRTGETEWNEPLETTSAVNLTKAYLKDLQDNTKTLQDQTAKANQRADSNTLAFNNFLRRGDLDFVEQLWVLMRKSVSSYQDVGDCLKLVINALRSGDIKPWVHRDSSSSLSRLILRSYHGQIEVVSLTGLTPVNMLLEMGVDKMRKDYINLLIGEELATINHLSYYLSNEVDLLEQVARLMKMHHLLEVIAVCNNLLGLPYDQLLHLAQSCLQHYRTSPLNENHEFKMQIQPAIITHIFQKQQPLKWAAEVCSGHGPREVRTVLQLSDRPLIDHVMFEMDEPNETINGCNEEAVYLTTMMCSSLAVFT